MPDQYADLHPSGFDYLLTAIAGSLTAYAAGMSVASEVSGWIFVIVSLLGVWISFAVMRTIRGTRFATWNGFIYTGGVLAAFFSARSLVELLPDNPFKAQIFVCGLLLCMLAFGSFLIWSDQTLLFQAVPSIAIFGLVGCYDTYRDATWLFFGFLLCFATLLARVHSRTMLRQAKESGYSQSGDRMDRSATELQRMRSGPWKWVAGPQWALGSAFVVILFSFLGAPIIRQSVQGVAGAVRVQAPLPSRSSASVATTTFDGTGVRVGTGPNEFEGLPLFRATLDQKRYMRTAIYQNYTLNGWQSVSSQPVGDKTNVVLDRSTGRLGITAIKAFKTIGFEIEPLTSRLTSVPVPGEILHIEPADNTVIRQDATLTLETTGTVNLYKGSAIVSDANEEPKDAIRDLPPGMEGLLSTTGVRPSVFDLANRVAASGETDFDRAQLIKKDIEKRAKYNLNAAAIPAGNDPVETFLFDTREGYCDLFASSMVLMARSVGIPARLVIGYYPISAERDEYDRYVVLDSEKHAWAELFFQGHGWVVFDPTEGAQSVPGGERGASNASALSKSGYLRTALDIVIGLGVLVILALSLRAVLKGVKLGPSRTDLDREYLKFAGVLAKASGKSRNFDQTTSEYVRDTLRSLNGEGERAKALNSQFERLFYSPEEPTREGIRELRKEVAILKANVKARGAKVA